MSTYNKVLVFETPDLKVFDYSHYSYVVKTDREWYTKHGHILRETLKNGKYSRGFTVGDDKFSGWKFDKKSNSELQLRNALCNM